MVIAFVGASRARCDAQTSDWGPRRIREVEIRQCFTSGWTVERIEPVFFETNIDPFRAHAWHATIARTSGGDDPIRDPRSS